MKYFCLSLYCIILLSCHNVEKTGTTGSTEFGKIKLDSTIFLSTENYTSFDNRRYLSLDYFDKFFEHVNITESIDTAKKFKRKIVAKNPVILRSGDYRDNLKYVLFPGDSLSIDLDENHLLRLKSLKDSSRNRELKFFNSLMHHEPEMAYYQFGKSIMPKGKQSDFLRDYQILYVNPDLDFRAKYAWQKYHDQLSFLNNYNQQYHLSDKSYIIFKKMLYYDYMYTKIKIANALLKAKKVIGNSLTNELNQFNVNIYKDDFLYDLFYRLSIKYYLDYLLLKNEIPSTAKNEFIIKQFNGKIKDYILFSEIKTALAQQAYDEKAVDFFNSHCRNIAYQQEIAATVALSIPTKESVLINQKNKRITFDSLIKQNKGKVLYIDFWASWCVPCIQQIPSSLALQKDFQNLPIQFYYISLDKSSSSYKEMSTQLKLPNHEDYILMN
ncbi:MAG: TlpA family protein disulfide reductase, partial [Bacteroidetes bacterium]|nr:TlpA family protein disulfide reductase [Bacteroidota bacterium]